MASVATQFWMSALKPVQGQNEEDFFSCVHVYAAFSRQTHLVDVRLVARLTRIGCNVATFSRHTQLTDVCPELNRVSSNPRARIYGNSAVASCTLADVYKSGFLTLELGDFLCPGGPR